MFSLGILKTQIMQVIKLSGSLYYCNMKFILFLILPATTLRHIGWIYKFAQLARSCILANHIFAAYIGLILLI